MLGGLIFGIMGIFVATVAISRIIQSRRRGR